VSRRATSRFAAVRAVLEQAATASVFPAAAIEVGTSTQAIWQSTLGRQTYDASAPPTAADTVFDLASLTKVLSTTPLVMRQVERGALGLDDLVATHAPSWRGADRDGVTIRDLLAHCSGLPPHRPLYLDHRGTAAYEEGIGALPLEYTPRTQALYSDLDFILLGAILERLAPLPQQFDALRNQMRPCHTPRWSTPRPTSRSCRSYTPSSSNGWPSSSAST
jgi:CubicO group peptidase (beta-lactamase class C family)